MPHLVITASKGVIDPSSPMLRALHEKAVSQGFAAGNIKLYVTETVATLTGGEPGKIAHLTFRMLDKAERTEDVRRGWLRELLDVMKQALPEDVSVAGEVVFLPPVYGS